MEFSLLLLEIVLALAVVSASCCTCAKSHSPRGLGILFVSESMGRKGVQPICQL